MDFWPEHSQAILPEPHDMCLHKNCLKFYNYEDLTVFPNHLFFVDLGLYANIRPNDKIILKIQHKVQNKDWQIVGEYFIPHHRTKTIEIPIIAKNECVIKAKEILFYAKLFSEAEVYQQLTTESGMFY